LQGTVSLIVKAANIFITNYKYSQGLQKSVMRNSGRQFVGEFSGFLVAIVGNLGAISYPAAKEGMK